MLILVMVVDVKFLGFMWIGVFVYWIFVNKCLCVNRCDFVFIID